MLVSVAQRGYGTHVEVLRDNCMREPRIEKINADAGKLHLYDRHKGVHDWVQLCDIREILRTKRSLLRTSCSL